MTTIGSTLSMLPSPYCRISSSTLMKASSGRSCRLASTPPALPRATSHKARTRRTWPVRRAAQMLAGSV
eukprot:4287946-Prymnesium_polylepis.3